MKESPTFSAPNSAAPANARPRGLGIRLAAAIPQKTAAANANRRNPPQNGAISWYVYRTTSDPLPSTSTSTPNAASVILSGRMAERAAGPSLGSPAPGIGAVIASVHPPKIGRAVLASAAGLTIPLTHAFSCAVRVHRGLFFISEIRVHPRFRLHPPPNPPPLPPGEGRG